MLLMTGFAVLVMLGFCGSKHFRRIGLIREFIIGPGCRRLIGAVRVLHRDFEPDPFAIEDAAREDSLRLLVGGSELLHNENCWFWKFTGREEVSVGFRVYVDVVKSRLDGPRAFPGRHLGQPLLVAQAEIRTNEHPGAEANWRQQLAIWCILGSRVTISLRRGSENQRRRRKAKDMTSFDSNVATHEIIYLGRIPIRL